MLLTARPVPAPGGWSASEKTSRRGQGPSTATESKPVLSLVCSLRNGPPSTCSSLQVPGSVGGASPPVSGTVVVRQPGPYSRDGPFPSSPRSLQRGLSPTRPCLSPGLCCLRPAASIGPASSLHPRPT